MSLSTYLVLAANTVADATPVQEAASAIAQHGAAAAEAAKAAGFSLQPTFGEVIEFQLTGLLVVFTVLGGLTLMCYLLAWLLKTVAPDQYHCKPKRSAALPVKAVPPKVVAAAATVPAAAVATAPAAALATASLHPGLADEAVLAILAVAATEALGQAVAIVRFRPMDSMDWTWSVQGRVGLHTSHTP